MYKSPLPCMQAALGELTFESEAATGLRAELRAAQEQASSLQQQLQQSHQQVQQSENALGDAQQAVAAASHGTEEQQRVQKQLQVCSYLSADIVWCVRQWTWLPLASMLCMASPPSGIAETSQHVHNGCQSVHHWCAVVRTFSTMANMAIRH